MKKKIMMIAMAALVLSGCTSVRYVPVVAQEGLVDARNYKVVQEISDSQEISSNDDCSMVNFIDLTPGDFNEIVGIRIEKRIETKNFLFFSYVKSVRCDFRALGLKFKY